MGQLAWVTAALSVLCGGGAAVCQNRRRWLGRFLWKTCASVLFCMTALLALWSSGNWRLACPILAALVLGLVGDLCLAAPPLTGRDGLPRAAWLSCGLVFFGLGHLVYLGLFLARADWQLLGLLAAPVMPAVLYFLVRLGFCAPEPRAVTAGMYVYAAVVSAMAGAAVVSALGGGSPLWSAAALLFVFSDSALTRDTFPRGKLPIDPCLPFVVLVCYFTAQNLFALSILY